MPKVKSSITNGVNLDDLTSTIQAVKEEPAIAKFQFHISNRWLGGGHNESKVNGFSGAMQQLEHAQEFTLEAGEHPVLLGSDEGANPVEYLLHALAGCVTTSMVYHAAAEGIEVEAVESTIEGDVDLRGFLGLDPTVRSGYQGIKMNMRIKTKAEGQDWEKLLTLGPKFSPVYDSLTKGLPVEVQTERM
jgi:uncharacterized OsmC-like protein